MEFTTLAVTAKNVMTSVSHYLFIETAFTAVQWLVVGQLTPLAFARRHRSNSRSRHRPRAWLESGFSFGEVQWRACASPYQLAPQYPLGWRSAEK
jgi:hypothetical protein